MYLTFGLLFWAFGFSGLFLVGCWFLYVIFYLPAMFLMKVMSMKKIREAVISILAAPFQKI